MKLRHAAAWMSLAAGFALAGCVMVEKTYDQKLYDTCVDHHNKEFRFKPGYRAMVAGAGYGSTRCYWVWSRASLQEARDAAIQDCQAEKGYCTVFSDSNGLAPWALRISNNGGRDPGGPPSLGSHGDFPSNHFQTPSFTQPTTTTPPAPTGGGGNGGSSAYACFDREQNAIAARLRPRVEAATGICMQSTVSRDMWQAVTDAAIRCGMPAAAIAQFRQNVESSKQSMANSCIR